MDGNLAPNAFEIKKTRTFCYLPILKLYFKTGHGVENGIIKCIATQEHKGSIQTNAHQLGGNRKEY